MGNIADALKKAGVELDDTSDSVADTDVPQQGSTQGTKEATEPIEREHQDADSHEQQPPVPSARQLDVEDVEVAVADDWEERIDLAINRSSQTSEAFRVLRSRILFPKDGEPRPKTIMVASSAPEEGKSFVSVNLAVAIARGLDQYALLVDCDLRRPSLGRLLGLASPTGLSDYLLGSIGLSELIRRTTVTKLSLLPSGDVPENPAELLTSARMDRLVTELSGRYSDRLIIFDSPPFQVASESIVLSKKVDGVVLVIGYGKSDRSRIKEMVEIIGREKIIGIVFNGQRESYLKNKMLDRYGGYGKYYSADEDRK